MLDFIRRTFGRTATRSAARMEATRAVDDAMRRTESYKNKTFIVEAPDTRLRKPDSLLEYERDTADGLPTGEQAGNFKYVPQNTEVRVDKIAVVPSGSTKSIVFAHVLAKDSGAEIGWVSTRNLKGKFVNETLGATAAPPSSGKYGPFAAWSRGRFLKQIMLVEIVDSKLDIERIALETLGPYLELVAMAERDGVLVALNSGFRSYPQQKYLYDGYVSRRPGFNLAAKPGYSNHQSGIAFDIAVAGSEGNSVYDWLKINAPAHGFVRTVTGEPWHWEYDKAKAAVAVAAGTFKTSNVTA